MCGGGQGAQRGSQGPGSLCLSAPFAQPRPLAGRAGIALFS